MAEEMNIKDIDRVVVRFAGDSGDGMQLAGTIFSNISAILGNDISTFPDYPSEIRAPQGTLGGVSGFQIHIGADKVYTSGDECDVLVAMNPAALKTNVQHLNRKAIIIIDSDSFTQRDLEKAEYKSLEPFKELGITNQIVEAPITSMCQESLKEWDLDNRTVLRSKNMMALGLTCWLFNLPIEYAEQALRDKFGKMPKVVDINIKVLNDGYNYGHNIHASVSTYRIEAKGKKPKGFYMDVNGNLATSYGLVAAAEKAGMPLFLGSYPITPATDILHNLAKFKELGVVTVQCEDEIAGCASAVGAAFAGSLAVTSTSGPGVCLKSEAMNLAVIAELPLVIVNVQRGGPSTGLPTKSEQTDLLQAMYGRNGESPMVVISATSPADCFDAAFWASKIAVEHMTPVVLLTDGYVANGAAAWRIPDLSTYPTIKPPYVKPEMKDEWKPYNRDEKTHVRYWALPGTEGFVHRLGGLEKNYVTGAISTEAKNHQRMVNTRQDKLNYIANCIPELEVFGDEDADCILVGWGSTYGHLYSAMKEIRSSGSKIAFAHFKFINPFPKNTFDVLTRYKKVIVAEQNLGQLALLLRGKNDDLNIYKYNRVEGQPFNVGDLVSEVSKIMEDK